MTPAPPAMNPASAFHMPTRIRVGRGARSNLTDELRTLGARRVFLISDEGVAAAGWLDDARERAAAAGCLLQRQTDVEPNPKAHSIDELGAAARAFRADCVVGIGGGSALDAAKSVALLLENPGSCTRYEGLDRFDRPPAPFIALPTTCGTGSEVTRVSVISVPEEGRKISVKGDAMFPAVALVDADFIDTLPARLVATTGMDALTHAVEAVIGRPANPVSDALAAEAVRRLLRDLPAAADVAVAVAKGGTTPAAVDGAARALADDTARAAPRGAARESVMLASTLAGMAFGNADVGAVHCLSESIGGQTDLPHGLLNAVLLAPVLRYQMDAIAERLALLDAATGGAGSAEGFIGRIADLAGTLDIAALSDLNLTEDIFPTIADLSERNGSNASNLMDLGADDYLAILRSA